MIRKLGMGVLILVLAAPVVAGDLDSWIELARKDLQTDKQAILTEVMDFSEAEANAFWPLYREYLVEASKLGDRRIALLKGYARDFDTMTDARAKELVEQSLRLQSDRVDLMKKYYKKFEKAVGATKAARVLQVEHELYTLIDLQIMAETPLIQASELMP